MELKEEYFKIAEERINNARLNQQTGGKNHNRGGRINDEPRDR